MEAAVQTLQQQVAELQQRIHVAEGSNDRIARMLENSRAEVKKLEAIANQTDFSAKNWQLVDFETMTPDVFSNNANQSYKVWAKKVKALTNATLIGFRAAVD